MAKFLVNSTRSLFQLLKGDGRVNLNKKLSLICNDFQKLHFY